MKKDDKLKKTLEELMEQLNQTDDSEKLTELKLNVSDVLDSFADISAKTKNAQSKPDHKNRHAEKDTHLYDKLIADTILNNLNPVNSHTFVFIKTLDDIDKKSLKEAVSFTKKCYKGPDCIEADIIAVANTVPSKYFLEGMVFTRDGVFWEYDNNIYYIEYKDIESVLVPESEGSSRFGDNIMLIERYSNDQITIPFDHTLYNDYRAIGNLLTELNRIAVGEPIE